MPDSTIIDIAIFANGLIGRNGGIRFCDRLTDHNIYLSEEISSEEYQELEQQQLIVIGVSYLPITPLDIGEFLGKLRDRLELKVFDNGRTYIFEGIHEINPTTYEIMWGV